jgi:hypothetical protein
MNFLRRALGINNEASVPAAPSKPDLTQQEIDDIVKDFLIKGRPRPTNQQIAEKLGRTIEEVNNLRPPRPYLHKYYDSDGDDDHKPLYYNDPERQQIIDDFLKETSGKAKGLGTDTIFKARNAYDHVRQGENTTRQQKINTGLPLNQDRNLHFVKPITYGAITYGGRSKTISNKNKKKHKKLSRQRRHHSKKNRKSTKRK